MERDTAISIAQFALHNFLRSGYEEHNIKLRKYEGRWNIYSVDISHWHIQLSDNGGKIISATDRNQS